MEFEELNFAEAEVLWVNWLKFTEIDWHVIFHRVYRTEDLCSKWEIFWKSTNNSSNIYTEQDFTTEYLCKYTQNLEFLRSEDLAQ